MLVRDAPFFSVKRDQAANQVTNLALPYFCTAIVRGRWVRNAVELCRGAGLSVDDRRRPLDCQAVVLGSKPATKLGQTNVAPATLPDGGIKEKPNISVLAHEFIVK